MKPTVIGLIISGAVALLAGGWLSAVLPVTILEKTVSDHGRTLTTALTQTVWGRSVHESVYVIYANQGTKPHGEGVLQIPDEYLDEGPLNGTGARHGKWTRHDRDRGVWRVSERWYFNGYGVTREERERRR